MVGLEIHEVDFSYSDGLLLRGMDCSVDAGDMVGLLGPNGSGKSTLIKLASGILRPRRGYVSLNGVSLKRLSRKSIARKVAVVPQRFNVPFAFTATEVIMMGRTPFLKTFTGVGEIDRRTVLAASELMGIGRLGESRFNELSGGEQQKVILAMALAQEPELLLLDEPTAHLDIAHQIEILEKIRRLNLERGLTVIAAMHDLNLASLYFDRLILLEGGRILADGTPKEVLTEAKIAEAFSASVRVGPHSVTGDPHVFVVPSREKV